MREYPKIETVFVRDTKGTKKLIEGEFRNPAVEYLKDNPWYFTEKIDGTNISVVWNGHKVEFHGRTEKAQIPSSLVNYLNRTFGTGEVEELFEQTFGENEAILFGEGYGRGIQNGGLYRDDVSFILFDVLVGHTWLRRDSIENIAKCFNIQVIPIIMIGKIDEAIQFVKTSPSSTIGTAKMEGLVGKPLVEMSDRLGKRVIVKIKGCDFAGENT